MAGVYIHIPFCKQACHYCDFHFSTNLERKDQLLQCLQQEIVMQKDYLGKDELTTIYFGGGTPSVLSPEDINSLLDVVKKNLVTTPALEITLEANPDDMTHEKLSAWYTSGINRLSVGIQSFDDNVLRFLNRSHDSPTATNAVGLAKAIGYDNISLDLIFAIPGQPLVQWLKNIKQALSLDPQHISAYSLTIEENTVFGRRASLGKFKPVSDDTSAQEMEILVNTLEENGFEQYEVSNFSRPGFQSIHNSSYWKHEKYLGIGPSAHSYDGVNRQFNVSNNNLYVKSIESGRVPFTKDILSREDKINEYILTSLRTKKGCDLNRIHAEYDADLVTSQQHYIRLLTSRNLAVFENGTLRLTREGFLLADKIASDFFIPSISTKS